MVDYVFYNNNVKCEWEHNGNCNAFVAGMQRECGRCPYSSGLAAVRCSMFCPHEKALEHLSSLEKTAAWRDVADKGRAIAEQGGVEIVRNDSDEVEAYVMSGVVDGQFPVSDGGPYDTILAKGSWVKAPNYGGWVQGFLCDCDWGDFHGGMADGRHRWAGRFCSHAYATLIVTNSRARNNFMGDRVGSAYILGECEACGQYGHVSPVNGLCHECESKKTLDAFVASAFCSSGAADEWLVKNADENLLAKIAKEAKIEDVDESVSIVSWNGYRVAATRKNAGVKDATRHFSGQEMQELEHEIDGLPLHNKGRLKEITESLGY